MAYLYSTGSRDFGDIKYESDPAETQIDFEDDFVALKTGGNQVLVVSGSNVGIGTSTPDYTLDVAGAASIDDYIYHNGNANTYIGFPSVNKINLVANGHSFLKYDGDILINNANRDRDTKIMADNGAVILHVDAGTNMVGINTTTPSSGLHVDSSFATAISTKTADHTITATDSTILADASSASIVITLPPVAGCAGRIYTVKCTAKGNLMAMNVASNGSETIDGSTNDVILEAFGAVTLQSDGAGWYKIAEIMPPIP